MKHLVLLMLLFAASSCSPCDSASGPCIAVTVEGKVGTLDTLRVSLIEPVVHECIWARQGGPLFLASESLPVIAPVDLGKKILPLNPCVAVEVFAERGGVPLGRGLSFADLDPKVTNVRVVLPIGDCGIDDSSCFTEGPRCGTKLDPRCCAGVCINAVTDPKNCGKCGNDCGPMRMCEDGGCLCPKGQFWCGSDNRCVASCDGCNAGPVGCPSSRQCVQDCAGCDGHPSSCSVPAPTCVAACSTDCPGNTRTCSGPRPQRCVKDCMGGCAGMGMSCE